jgi:spermidine/putrescine transport system ATP-binding protein
VLELDSVTTKYGDFTAVDDVSLSVADGELFCLLGPSGSGKSTVLRTIAGFETPTAGTVRIGGVDVTGTPPYDRDCSMVFQEWALFPDKTVVENVAFGLKMAGVGETARRERAHELLDLVEITAQAEARPAELSGGQRQRVALARSLAVDPDLLLLDEPLSSLDRKLRETMQIELKRIHDRVGTTMVYVTHDQDEAFTLADRLGVMDAGKLIQVDRPASVYEDPTDRFVESFLGSTNFLDCRVAGIEAGSGVALDTPLGVTVRAPLTGSETDLAVGDVITMSLRPERLGIAPASGAADSARPNVTTPEASPVEDGGRSADPAGTDGPGEAVAVAGTVAETIHRGSDVRLRLSVGEATLVAAEPVESGRSRSVGDGVTVRFRPAEAVYFDASGARCR